MNVSICNWFVAIMFIVLAWQLERISFWNKSFRSVFSATEFGNLHCQGSAMIDATAGSLMSHATGPGICKMFLCSSLTTHFWRQLELANISLCNWFWLVRLCGFFFFFHGLLSDERVQVVQPVPGCGDVHFRKLANRASVAAREGSHSISDWLTDCSTSNH